MTPVEGYRADRWLMRRERLRVHYQRRGRDAFLGRFGGGWQWSLGIEAGRGFRTIIVNCLVAMVRIERGRRRGRSS